MQSSEFEPRRPDLREAAETLEQALAEACAGRSAHSADTGELIRIEEMLALASEAARRAISIRRKARHDAAASGGAAEPGLTEGLTEDQPADQLSLTSHRLFDDTRGVSWDVWAVYPEVRPSQVSALPGTFQSGWLVFESASEKRRLSPIPSDWQTLPQEELEQLCERAETAPARRGRTPGGLGEDVPPRSD